MLSNKDIKKAARERIRSVYDLPVYLDEVVDEFEKPCFFVDTRIDAEAGTGSTLRKHLSLSVTYYQATADEEDKLEKADVLTRLFLPSFPAGDRHLTPASLDIDIQGNYTDVMTFDLTVDFFDDIAAGDGDEDRRKLIEIVNVDYQKRLPKKGVIQ